MPLEIRELVIRATVSSNSSQFDENESGGEGRLSEADQSAIIAACIDQILSILQSRTER
jgi:hypothetical protein